MITEIIPAIGIASRIHKGPPIKPNSRTANIIHNGCRPMLSPIIFGVTIEPSAMFPNIYNAIIYESSIDAPKVK